MNQGLGFLALSPPQYLSTGVLVLLFVIAALLMQIFTDHLANVALQPLKDWPSWALAMPRAVAQGWSKAIAALGSLWFLFGVTTSFKMFRLDPGLASLMVGVIAFFGGLCEGYLVHHNAKIASASQRGDRQTTLAGNFTPKGAWRGLQDTHRLAIAGFAWAFAAILVFGLVLLGGVEPEFGGARPRTAYLDLETGRLDESTRAALVPYASPDAPAPLVQRSVAVKVFFADDNSFLVRTVQNGSAQDPLYEIHRSIVTVVVWVD